MNERERVIAICRELSLPPTMYTINGSGSMILHGITAEQRGKSMGDLDIFCATRLWFNLLNDHHWGLFLTDPEDPQRRCDPPYLYATFFDLEVNIFSSWRWRTQGNFDVNGIIQRSTLVDGIPCVPLEFVLAWKRVVGRAKDLVDVRVLEQFLYGAGTATEGWG